LQTTLQRCPRNSVEQLGQTEDASFFRFAGMTLPRIEFGGAGCAPTLRADGLRGEPLLGPVEIMFGVVAQVGQLEKPEKVSNRGAVPKW
jgi:hypothetical protein